MNPKYQIGQRVKFVNDPDSDAGEIVAYSYHKDSGFAYTISLKDFDFSTRQAVDAVKHLSEDEIVVIGESVQTEQPQITEGGENVQTV